MVFAKDVTLHDTIMHHSCALSVLLAASLVHVNIHVAHAQRWRIHRVQVVVYHK
jgi:hypothetical protein